MANEENTYASGENTQANEEQISKCADVENVADKCEICADASNDCQISSRTCSTCLWFCWVDGVPYCCHQRRDLEDALHQTCDEWVDVETQGGAT